VALLYSARTRDEVIYYDELRALAADDPRFSLRITLTRDSEPGWSGEAGRIGSPVACLTQRVKQAAAMFWMKENDEAIFAPWSEKSPSPEVGCRGHNEGGTMVKLVVLYGRPADPDAFERYYFGTHVPIFAKAPGVQSVVFSRSPITTIVAGHSDVYLIAEVAFASMGALQTALASEAGQAAVADLPNFASAGVTIFAFEPRS
jgi:uncharacterized protein (TIGR02118 family)